MSSRFDLRQCWVLFALIGSLTWTAYPWEAPSFQSALDANGERRAPDGKRAIVRQFDVNTEYGTLAFRGAVERTELQDAFEFLAQIEIMFLPGEVRNGHTVVNRTKVADLSNCELVATIWSGKNEPAEVLYRESYPIAISLSEYGETAWLPDLRFRVAKSIAARATHIGLSVTDGRLLWPVAVELKE